MGQDMSDYFSSIGGILEGNLVDDYENMDAHDRARTQILVDKFSGQRAPFRNIYLESQIITILVAKGQSYYFKCLHIMVVVYRLVQKKGTVLVSTSLAWPAVAGCSRAETFSQLSSIYFAQPCI